MSDPVVRHVVGQAKRQRRVPLGATCSVCGGNRLLVPTRTGDVRCYEHLAGAVASIELDHPAGYANVGTLVVPLRANAHREVTEWRRVLGMDTWPPAAGDPLLALAHFLAGFATLVILVAEWLVGFVSATRTGLAAPPFPIVL